MANDVILLVEDDPDDQELTISCLARHRIGRIEVAEDGVQALERLRDTGRELPRVVLLDLKLPRQDGFEVLRHIRAEDRTALLPVVVMTSSREERDRVGSYRGGANSFVVKPIDFEQFQEAIRQLGIYWIGLNQPAHW